MIIRNFSEGMKFGINSLKQKQGSDFEKSPKIVEVKLEVEWDMKLKVIDSIFIERKRCEQMDYTLWDI